MASILRTDSLQNLNTSNIITQTNATTLTIGASGQTISIPAGATLTNNGTASGFGLTWQSVQTTGFTAVKGNAYPCDTTSASFTVTLPATPSAGDQVQLVDYAGTFDSNALIIDPNGEDIEGGTDNLALTGEREGVILTYIDSTQGWIATSGINEGTNALSPGPYSVSYLIIAGGGGGGNDHGGGGGGAGGYLTGTTDLNLNTIYTLTVGGGGANGVAGSNSTAFSLTSIGGGFGGSEYLASGSGGSGGGGAGQPSNNTGGNSGASGTVGQGNTGGTGANGSAINYGAGGGGGGATGTGATGAGGNPAVGGNGGNGTASSITGSSVIRAGGGGGGGFNANGGTGGTGGGGNGANVADSTAPSGTANTGGGGGGSRGAGPTPDRFGGAGGSGIIILSVPTANYSGTTTGSPTITTSGANTILQFTGSGSYTG
jgi:hypothetical protein